MPSIVLDSKIVEKLRAAGQRVELCDSAGKILGYFLPSTDPGLYKIIECPFTEEEIEKARNEPGGRTLDEIMQDLRKRA